MDRDARAGRRRRDARAAPRTAAGGPARGEQLGGAGAIEERRQPGQLLGAQLIADVVASGSARSRPDRRRAPRTRRARSWARAASPCGQALLQQGDVVGADGAGAAGPAPRRRTAGPSARARRRRDRRACGEARGGARSRRRRSPARRWCPTRRPAPRRAAPRGSAASGRARLHSRRSSIAELRDAPSSAIAFISAQRHLADQQHRAHGAEARDGDAGDDAQLARRGRVAGAGDQAQVDLAALEQLGAARRQLERQLEAIVAQAVLEAVGDRPGVQERDGGELLLRGFTTRPPDRGARRAGTACPTPARRPRRRRCTACRARPACGPRCG